MRTEFRGAGKGVRTAGGNNLGRGWQESNGGLQLPQFMFKTTKIMREVRNAR
jgi:hypothetical protein